MTLARILKKPAIILTLMLLVGEAFMYEVSRHYVEVPMPMETGASVSAPFFILFSGRYKLHLVFDRKDPGSHETLESALGRFGCWNTKLNTPCDEYSPYAISWEISSRNDLIASGIGNEQVRGGGQSKEERAEGLGVFRLPPGRLELEAVVDTPLPELADLNPRIVISAGKEGAKNFFPSAATSYVGAFWLVGRFLLWPLVLAMWAAIILGTLLTDRFGRPESGNGA